MDDKVLVVGGGPVGCMFASLMAPSFTTTVIEEHDHIGIPVQCTGLVSPRVVETAKAEDAVLAEFKGALFHFPNEVDLEVRGKKTKAVLVDRARFDLICCQRAIDAGAEVITGERFLDFTMDRKGVLAHARAGHVRKEHRVALIIGADGYKSTVGRSAGLGHAKDAVRGLQVDLAEPAAQSDMLDVFVGNDVAPGFFGWRIPCGSFARVGVCVSQGSLPPVRYLNALLKRLELDREKVTATHSGLIPFGPPARTYGERVMLIGDSAAQAKPLSGGGLYTGFVAARCAAKVAGQALTDGDLSAKRLSEYQSLWKAELGRELDRGLLLRRAYKRMRDGKLEEIARTLDKPEVREVLSAGDIDFPISLAPQILKAAPSLVRNAPQFLRSLLW